MPRNRSGDTYLFVDGEYLRRIYCDAMDSVFETHGEINVQQMKNRARATRVFIYDCLDEVRRSGEDDASFNARVAAQEAAFDKFRAPGGVHIRLGSLRGTRRIRQKEVDVMLATDMLTHGYDGNMEKAVLLAGDLDFRPIIDALVRRGILTEIWYEPKSAAKELPGAADFGLKIGFNDLYGWSDSSFQQQHQIPSVNVSPGNVNAGAQWTPIREGSLNGRIATLFQDRGDGRFLIRIEDPSSAFWASHDNADVLKRYLDVLYGIVKW